MKAVRNASLSIFKIVNTLFPKKLSPLPVLMLSYPRSGSSWAGKLLAMSPGFVYLREPVTQPFLKAFGGERPLFDVLNSGSNLRTYQKLADEAFSGAPVLHPGVIDKKRDFLPLYKNIRQKLLIKEVNPLAAQFYCDRFNLQLLILLRHPAAIALSYYERGWLEKHVDLLDSESNDSVWGKFGQLYGSYMKSAVDVATQYEDAEIIKYEDLVEDPHANYKKVLIKCNVPEPDNFDKIINEYCFSSDDLNSSYKTQRNSKATSEKWKSKLSNNNLKSLREGFNKSGLMYYRDDKYWQL